MSVVFDLLLTNVGGQGKIKFIRIVFTGGDKLRKNIYLLFLLLFAALSTGCGTIWLLSAAPNKKTVTKINTISTEDQLYAVGRVLNDELLQQFPGSVALVGRNSVYVIVKGGDRFFEIVKRLNGHHLFLTDEKGNKLTEEKSFKVNVKNSQFNGKSKFLYQKPKAELSDEEIRLIKSSGTYEIGENASVFEVDFVGFIPKVPVQVQGDQAKFKSERKIVLNETQEQFSSVLDVEKFMVLPLIVAIDIYTLPFQALIFAVDRLKR